ncbi:VVA0879 family protein [Corynebacterium glutamicum]|uniref:VVA0879 family protein n=1 Tax=Corynebacterium glutamicum TaxID=1718 RepID=UPI001468AF83|nr:VVA0879 family protein [Corynebacterium glutamicum]GFK19293.1 hypothetical protein KbCgl_18650 [Corynebacterium glutamicum]
MTQIIKRTQEELTAELRARFGDDHWKWAFQCPACKDIATPQDFKDGGGDPDKTGQMCIGRALGALEPKSNEEWKKSGGRGCDWTAFGLFQGPEFVIMPNGREVPSFPIAPAA